MSRAVERSLRFYRLALYAAPADFRRQHGDELARVVSERLEERVQAGGSVWRSTVFEIADVLRTGTALRLRNAVGGRTGLPFGAALRTIGRRPAFAALCTLTLALGLGLAMSIAAVVDTVLIRPLPYKNARDLVMVWRILPRANIPRGPTSYLDYLDWRASAKSFADLAAYTGGALTMEEGEPERFTGLRVSGNLFRALGNEPALGRVITDADDRPGTEPAMVLSHALWQRRFGADPAIVGRVLTFGDQRVRVIGVMKPDFMFPSAGPQFWTALQVDPAKTQRNTNRYTIIGRLARGTTIDQAEREMKVLNARLAVEHTDGPKDAGVGLELRQTTVTRPVRSLLSLIALAGALVLLMACVNLGNLFLVRGVARRREIAVRRALGATRGAIRRETLAVSVVIAVTGAAVGTAVAALLTKLLLHLGPPIPRAAEITLTPRVALAGLFVALMTTIAAGLASLSSAQSIADAESLATSGRGGDAPRARRLYTAFVATQVALAFVLFVAAGLLSRSFYNLVTAPRGFDGSRVLTARISLPPARYGSHEKILMYYDQLLPRLRALPGVSLASGTWALPFSEDYASSAMVPDDRPAPDHAPALAVIPVLPSFFQTLGVALREGRDFTAADREGSPDVAVVNETLARSFWPRESAIGKRLRSAKDDRGKAVTIVGVVSDIKRRGLDQPPEAEIYLPYAQATYNGDLWVALRTESDPNLLVSALRRTTHELDRTLPLALVGTLDQMVESTVIVPRFRTMLIGTFAVLAGVMALLGVYGVLGFVVARRKQEIAIRGALGATPTRAFRSVAGQALGIAAVGIAFGVLGAVGASVGLRSMVFGISAFDPITFAAAIVALGGVAILGAWLPARRASRVDPMLVLREDASV